MASFPELTLSADNFKVRFRELFASEVLNQRFVSEPIGVYHGFDPLVSGDDVILNVSPVLGVSLLRVVSLLSKTSLDVFFAEDITVNFTGHDFGASGDLYIIATVSYVRGGTTTARIFTRTTPASGVDEVGICRVSGTGAPGTITAFATDIPDRHSPLAKMGSPNTFGYMPAGSVEDSATLFAQSKALDIDPVPITGNKTLNASDMGKTFLLDFSALVSNPLISLPDSTTLEDGQFLNFLLVEANGTVFDAALDAVGTDVIEFLGGKTPVASPVGFKNLGYFFQLAINKNESPACWYRTLHTLPLLHASTHSATGVDPLKLDDLAPPDDNTDLDVSVAAHGLAPKLSGSGTDVFRGDGTYGPAPAPGAVVFHPLVLAPPGPHPINADGTIYRLDASAPITIQLPDSAGLPNGAIARLQADVTGSAVSITTLGGPDKIRFPNGLPLDSLGWTPGFQQDAVEFVLDKDVASPPLWKLNRFVRPPKHASTHEAGGDDEIDVTALGGFPGSTGQFLRGDGSFAAPASEYFFAGFGGTTNLVGGANRMLFNASALGSGIFHSGVDSSFTVTEGGIYMVSFSSLGIGFAPHIVELRTAAGGATLRSRAITLNAGGGFGFNAILSLVPGGTFDLALISGAPSSVAGETQVSVFRYSG